MNAALLAERGAADLIQNAEFLWLVGAFAATLLVGALVFAWIERWRKRQLSDSPRSDVEQLSTYRSMYESGELSKEEYDRIKAREAHRLREKVIAKPTPSNPAHPEPPAKPAPPEPDSSPPQA